MENPACVHAHMDLLKLSLKLVPYCDPDLFVDVLKVALDSRALDVGAGPYDCSDYRIANLDYPQVGLSSGGNDLPAQTTKPIPTIRVENADGRKQYKALQTELMRKARPVRAALLLNYTLFLNLGFTKDQVTNGELHPSTG